MVRAPVTLVAEKVVSEVAEDSVSTWEEAKAEDDLSPEEIQMVGKLPVSYTS